jgi:hypothetical protein
VASQTALFSKVQDVAIVSQAALDATIVSKAALDADVGSETALYAAIVSQVALDAAINAQSTIFCKAQEAVVVCQAALRATKVSDDALVAAILSQEADPAPEVPPAMVQRITTATESDDVESGFHTDLSTQGREKGQRRLRLWICPKVRRSSSPSVTNVVVSLSPKPKREGTPELLCEGSKERNAHY